MIVRNAYSDDDARLLHLPNADYSARIDEHICNRLSPLFSLSCNNLADILVNYTTAHSIELFTQMTDNLLTSTLNSRLQILISSNFFIDFCGVSELDLLDSYSF